MCVWKAAVKFGSKPLKKPRRATLEPPHTQNLLKQYIFSRPRTLRTERTAKSRQHTVYRGGCVCIIYIHIYTRHFPWVCIYTHVYRYMNHRRIFEGHLVHGFPGPSGQCCEARVAEAPQLVAQRGSKLAQRSRRPPHRAPKGLFFNLVW